ncbi:hypothetical protein [Ammoniphilus sp. 3BR4]|uniref:hypothetical protein n=1 Tax=Ammoniphilus sp. 3BR4 TaxID=3158265 RepID=UPI00346677A7
MDKILLSLKWRKLRLRVWNKRLQDQLSLLSTRMNLSIPCLLHVSWGPFYGGSVVVERRRRKATILIQIPYDGHITTNEQEVMATYHIPKRALPYFILFHEFSHLLDALPYINADKNQVLQTYQSKLKKEARLTKDYRNLNFEEKADYFAFEQYQNSFGQVS